ncbi:N-acetyltransferase [Acrasis kona]|uniref:N-acetyltransferase n=1 Tax=Acrasis kona TaxID=1008807 RepID=A0AAW2YHA2_9EUKA
MIVREFEEDDETRVKELFILGMNEHNINKQIHPVHFKEYIKMSLISDLSSVNENYFKETFGRVGGFWVAVDDFNIVQGMVGCQILSKDGCELRRMSVHSDYRGRGVGRDLLNTVISHAQSQGLSQISLSCWPHQHDAIAMYRKYGFQITSEQEVGSYGVKVVFMNKSLSDA